MASRRLLILSAASAAILIPQLLLTPRASNAMPNFAQAYFVPSEYKRSDKCQTCHTIVPELNAYGRFVQRSAYATLDYAKVSKQLPVWVGESANYDSTAGSGTGLVPRYSLGNLAVHADGFIGTDFTYHAQQWVTASNGPGFLDTFWVSYNKIINNDGHLYVGKLEDPAPSPYSQTFDIDGPNASGTMVGEHNWGNTYGNRWGTKLAYVKQNYSLEAGYVLSSDDIGGVSDFAPGDKTFQWKATYAGPKMPFEIGAFGSVGSVPTSTGQDQYSSYAPYIQIDPKMKNHIPGLLAIYQVANDGNPGIDPNTGAVMPAVRSQGSSFELYEPIFDGAIIGARHDINYDGFHTVVVGNSINLAANVPYVRYAHVYFESRLGGSSSLAGINGNPEWKAMLWLTQPLQKAQ